MTETKILTKGLKSNFFNVSVWKIIDLRSSQQQGRLLKEKIADYNASRPTVTITDKLGRTRTYTKGRIRGNQHALAQELLYLCVRQLETLRRSDNPSDRLLYQSYLESDRLPVLTNRKELMDRLRINGVWICKNSIYNHLEILRDADIILHKRSTSRQRVFMDDGTVLYETCEKGRGDFQLFLNKAVFAFFEDYRHLAVPATAATDVENPPGARENAPAAAPGPENAAIGNQPISTPKSQKLGEIIPIISKTGKRGNNNRGQVQGQQSGVPAGQQDNNSGLHPQRKELERDSINPFVAARRGEIRPADRPGAALDAEERRHRHREMAEKKRLLSGLVARLTPREERPFYLRMLQTLYIGMLYPGINRLYLHRIEADLSRLLSLYLDLVPAGSPAEAFRQLSRAIEMVHRYRQKHPGYELYDPLSFLRMDYNSGFFRVVQQWLPKEERRLQLQADKRSHLVKWQKGQAYADDLFDGVVEALQTGLYQSKAVFVEAEKRLSQYLGRIKAAPRTKTRIKRSFRERFDHLYRELAQRATEADDIGMDATWGAFLRYLEVMDFRDDGRD